MPEVSCKAVVTPNSSEWPCSMCPVPPGSGLWGWGHPTYIFLIFPGHLEFWTPLQIPSWGPPPGCTLLHICLIIRIDCTSQCHEHFACGFPGAERPNYPVIISDFKGITGMSSWRGGIFSLSTKTSKTTAHSHMGRKLNIVWMVSWWKINVPSSRFISWFPELCYDLLMLHC